MIYFDNSATTPLCAGAKEAIGRAVEHFGNPSSLHAVGVAAKELVERTRQALYRSIDAREEKQEIVFTSGGTESNNLAILGSAFAKNRRRPKILITDSEHPCINEPCRLLEQKGFSVARIGTRGGRIDEERFREELNEDVFLISFMLVNNETGAVYDVPRLFCEAKERFPEVLCHTDAVQAFMKIPLTMRALHADMVTLSSHKIGGPKGCGALVVDKNVIKRKALTPMLVGGGQEKGLRSGTQNVIGISGFGGAVTEKTESYVKGAAQMEKLRGKIIGMLPGEILVNDPPRHAPHILSLTLPNVKSETAVHFLSGKGICVSNGSACSSNGGHKSGVLIAYGLSEKQADATLRVSLSEENTEEDCEALVFALNEALETLVRFK